jgi:hypothetical protein
VIGGVLVLGVVVWDLSYQFDYPCLARHTVHSLQAVPDVEVPVPPGCRAVEGTVPEEVRWRFRIWEEPRDLRDVRMSFCLTDGSLDDVLRFYNGHEREWVARGDEVLRVCERFDGFVAGRRFMHAVPTRAADGRGTLVTKATAVQGRLGHLRQAFFWCNRDNWS